VVLLALSMVTLALVARLGRSAYDG
jgi:hypothetical protein